MGLSGKRRIDGSRLMQQVEIRVKGQIDQNWSNWCGGLTISHTEQGETVLSGSVRDQAALRGLLDRLADLGLQLISVSSTETDNPKTVGRCQYEGSNGLKRETNYF
jgi:hypothetical protein